MEEEGSFKSRLDQIFGRLGAATAQSSSWSVSSTQLERRQWKPAENSDEEDEEQQQQQQEFRSGEEEQGQDSKRSRSENAGDAATEGDELLEVEEMVGMDTTLDFEDEEDAYDKQAVGREGAGDRLYTNDLKAGAAADDSRSLPTTDVRRMSRDERAFHQGAADRLAEDAREANLNGSAALFKQFATGTSRIATPEKRKQDFLGNNRNNNKNRNPVEKRVRFSVAEKEEAEIGQASSNGAHGAHAQLRSDGNKSSARQDRYRNVPDHVRHPEKYTHYTLDWAEDADDRSNTNVAAWQAAMAAAANSSKTDQQIDEAAELLPQHVTFVPRSTAKKDRDFAMVDSAATSVAPSVVIAARTDADEDVIEDDGGSSQSKAAKPGRRSYRSRARGDE